MATIQVQARWDDEARVWTASSLEIDGLAVEASSLEALEKKVSVAVRDLLEANGSAPDAGHIPIELMTILGPAPLPARH